MSTTTQKSPEPKKTKIPPPGRKLSLREAVEQANKQFGKALSKLAK